MVFWLNDTIKSKLFCSFVHSHSVHTYIRQSWSNKKESFATYDAISNRQWVFFYCIHHYQTLAFFFSSIFIWFDWLHWICEIVSCIVVCASVELTNVKNLFPFQNFRSENSNQVLIGWQPYASFWELIFGWILLWLSWLTLWLVHQIKVHTHTSS